MHPTSLLNFLNYKLIWLANYLVGTITRVLRLDLSISIESGKIYDNVLPLPVEEIVIRFLLASIIGIATFWTGVG